MISTYLPSYILILLAAALGLLIPVLLAQLWRSGRGSKDKAYGRDAAQQKPVTRLLTPIAIRFHLAALLFLGFLGFSVLMFPLLFGVRSPDDGDASAFTLFGLALPMLIVLFYSLRKGDLSWVTPKSKEEEESE